MALMYGIEIYVKRGVVRDVASKVARQTHVISSKYGCAKPADPPDKMGFPMHTAHQLCPFGSSTGASGGLLA